MKGLFYVCSISLMFLMTTSCEPCVGVKCTYLNGIQFSLKDKQNNQQLFFGNNPSYSKDSLNIFQLVNGDTTELEIAFVQDPNGIDTLISIYYYSPTPYIFVKLNATDVDTIRVTYEENPETQECCEGEKWIQTIAYNNSFAQSVHQTGVKTSFLK
jgi:hypothetical protein